MMRDPPFSGPNCGYHAVLEEMSKPTAGRKAPDQYDLSILTIQRSSDFKGYQQCSGLPGHDAASQMRQTEPSCGNL